MEIRQNGTNSKSYQIRPLLNRIPLTQEWVVPGSLTVRSVQADPYLQMMFPVCLRMPFWSLAWP